MPDTQMLGLMKMMRTTPTMDYFEVHIPAIQIKKKSIKKLKKGDIIPLETREVKVEIVESGNIIAYGIYGNFQETPSILIDAYPESRKKSIDTKKYYQISISLGQIEKSKFDQGKIIKLNRDEVYDASLYRNGSLLAEATLVQVDDSMGLQIEEVK